jgi:hypothetical protein
MRLKFANTAFERKPLIYLALRRFCINVDLSQNMAASPVRLSLDA